MIGGILIIYLSLLVIVGVDYWIKCSFDLVFLGLFFLLVFFVLLLIVVLIKLDFLGLIFYK